MLMWMQGFHASWTLHRGMKQECPSAMQSQPHSGQRSDVPPQCETAFPIEVVQNASSIMGSQHGDYKADALLEKQ